MTESELQVFTKAIHTFGINEQYMKAIEEASEFIRALSRFSTSKTPEIGHGDFENLIEEMADLEIMLDQVQITLMDSNIISLTQTARAKKVERLAKRLDAIDKVKKHHGIN